MNQAQQSVILLDIESFLQFQQPVNPNLEALDNWMKSSHEKIWDAFTKALTSKFFEELQHGTYTRSN